jgi:hypothetical protein
LELTACTNIPDLYQYTVNTYNGAHTSPDFVFNQGGETYIPAGSHIYLYGVNGVNSAFFGFSPDIVYSSSNLFFAGNFTTQLLYQGSVVDSYGVVGVDVSSTTADFTLGWAERVSGTPPTNAFNVSDWVVHVGAYGSNPPTNANATPPVRLGEYHCP